MHEESNTIVIDNGSGVCKAGYAGDDAPRTEIPSMVGRFDNKTLIGVDSDDQARINGDNSSTTLTYPIRRGIITDWDAMECVWQHVFDNELYTSPEGQSILLTDSPLNRRSNREKMAQIMFEKFHVAEFNVHEQSTLSLYASGRTSGLVLSSGHGVTHAVPVFEGLYLPHAVIRMDLGGGDLDNQLATRLEERTSLPSVLLATGLQNAAFLKHKACYVARDYHKELEAFRCEDGLEKVYELPDGRVIAVGAESFQIPEALFQPSIDGLPAEGIHKMIFSAINKCSETIHRDLYGHIVLSGGNTMFDGIFGRLSDELKNLCGDNEKRVILAPEERRNSVWIGASIISSMGTFRPEWITRQEYDEYGPTVVHTKCH